MGLLTVFRIFCYYGLFFSSAATLGMTAARLHYTLHLPPHDPLNGGVDFYDPVIVEILATAGLSTILAFILIGRIHRRDEHGLMELIGLLFLFTSWMVGATITTQNWGDLGWCQSYSACRLLTAIVVFTWMSWVMTFLLAIACFSYITRHDGFKRPVYGQYNEQEMGQV